MPNTSFDYGMDDSSVMLGRISYLNVAPIYFGLDNGMRPAWLKMVTAPPAVLNRMLEKGILDISPVSISAYAANAQDWLLLPDLSISCLGEVMSVILVSHKPLTELHRQDVILTDESSTAVELLKLLFAGQGIKPFFKKKAIRKPQDVQDDAQAALIIGDAALSTSWGREFRYVFDLGKMWQQATGLPFVFAVWAARRGFAEKNPEVIARVCGYFQRSKLDGRRHIGEIAARASGKLGLPPQVCETYFNNLSYNFDDLKIEGAQRFFQELHAHSFLNDQTALSFFNQVRPRRISERCNQESLPGAAPLKKAG
jgi:chorismate dehydratase